MFRNYLASALGNLLKNRLFSFINIVGLAIGLAACLIPAVRASRVDPMVALRID